MEGSRLHQSETAELGAVARLVWASRRLLLVSACAAGAVGALYAFVATPWYRTQVTMLPVKETSAQGMLAQLAPLSGLAGLAGIDLDGGNNAEAMAVVRSHDFVRLFIEERGLLAILFSERWDAATGKWKSGLGQDPDIRDAVEYFERQVFRVGEDRKTGLVVLTIQWKDPVVAAGWANELAVRINAQLRERALVESERSVAYLRSELTNTTQVAIQQSIGKLLERQMQNLMVARGNEEYAFRIVDKAQVPKRRYKPMRLLLVAGSCLLGAILAAVFVCARSARGRIKAA